MEYFIFFLQNCWRCRSLFDGDCGKHVQVEGSRHPAVCLASHWWDPATGVLKCLSPDLTIPRVLASGRFCYVGLRWEGVSTVRDPVGTGQFCNLPLWWPDLRLLHDFQMGDFRFSGHSLPVACEISSNIISSNSPSNSHLTNFKIHHVIKHLLSWLSGYTLWESVFWGLVHKAQWY